MTVILGPDVFVNASVALGSAPDHVVRRVLGGKSRAKSTDWILAQVEQLLSLIPAFKQDSLGTHMATIRGLVDVAACKVASDATWELALVASAKASGVKRVVTDHPDLLERGTSGGIEFLSSDAWLVETTTPPPMPE